MLYLNRDDEKFKKCKQEYELKNIINCSECKNIIKNTAYKPFGKCPYCYNNNGKCSKCKQIIDDPEYKPYGMCSRCF